MFSYVRRGRHTHPAVYRVPVDGQPTGWIHVSVAHGWAVAAAVLRRGLPWIGRNVKDGALKRKEKGGVKESAMDSCKCSWVSDSAYREIQLQAGMRFRKNIEISGSIGFVSRHSFRHKSFQRLVEASLSDTYRSICLFLS
jgi:hypothetical protein